MNSTERNLNKIDKLPFEQLKKIGLDKEDILNFTKTSLNALVNGHRTDLIKIEVPNPNPLNNDQKTIPLVGKLQIVKDYNSGESKAVFHTRESELNNSYKLSTQEIEKLKQDQFSLIPKQFENQSGEKYDLLIALDKDLNKLVAINPKNINPPDTINNQPLTEQQKFHFKKGNPITIQGEQYIVNPTNELGISNLLGNTGKINSLEKKTSGVTFSYLKERAALNLVFATMALPHVSFVGAIIRQANINKKAHEENRSNEIYWNKLDSINQDLRKIDINNSTPVAVLADVDKAINTNLKGLKLRKYSGIVADLGKAIKPNTDKESYFVKMKSSNDNKMITFWSKSLEKLINDKNIEKGQRAQLHYEGKIATTFKIDDREITIQKKVWDIDLASNVKPTSDHNVALSDVYIPVPKVSLENKPLSLSQPVNQSSKHNNDVKNLIDNVDEIVTKNVKSGMQKEKGITKISKSKIKFK